MKTLLFFLFLFSLVESNIAAQTKDSTDNEDYYEHSPEDSVEIVSGEYMPVREAIYNSTRMPLIKVKEDNIKQETFLQKRISSKLKYSPNKIIQGKTAFNYKVSKENLLLKRQKLWTNEK